MNTTLNNPSMPPMTPRPNGPWVPPPRRPISTSEKLILMGVQCLVLMIGALIIYALAYNRDDTNKEVRDRITQGWGGKVAITGPQFVQSLTDDSLCVNPTILKARVNVTSKTLHRNIYEAEVFSALVLLAGDFDKEQLKPLGNQLFLKIDLPMQNVDGLETIRIADRTVPLIRKDGYAYARIETASLPNRFEFVLEMKLHGSESLYIKPVGVKSDITFVGTASNPSFQGLFLPTERSVDKDKFSAEWHIEKYSEYGEADTSVDSYTDRHHYYVGTTFLVGVDRYLMVERSLKYSFIFVVLTYISVFCCETLLRRRIPLVNYFLVGVALILFYSLLLSFVEHQSFLTAYIIAALMTIGLITGYMWRVLESRRAGLTIGAILTVLYVSCYILLTLSTYALLLGSLLLFLALAIMMYVSLKLNKS